VLLTVPLAVARAAAETGVAKEPIEDYDAYRRRLENMLGLSRGLMHELYGRARGNPKRIVFPEGDQEKIVRAAKILIDEKLAHPILLTHHQDVQDLLRKYNVDESKLTIIDINASPDYDRYTERFHDMRHRHGITMPDAHRILNSRNYYAMMMLESGDADGVIAGLRAYYPATVKPALQIVKTRPGVKHVSGAYLLMFKNRSIVLADTTVNIDPDSETLAEIAEQTAETAKRFNLEPRIAMISFSNFGSTQHDSTAKAPARSHRRRGDASRHRGDAGDRAAGLSVELDPGRCERARVRQSRRGQRSLQAVVEARRRGSDRTDPAGHRPAGARAATRRRRERHRQHGGHCGAGRAGAGTAVVDVMHDRTSALSAPMSNGFGRNAQIPL
jgi:hypothetical protein